MDDQQQTTVNQPVEVMGSNNCFVVNQTVSLRESNSSEEDANSNSLGAGTCNSMNDYCDGKKVVVSHSGNHLSESKELAYNGTDADICLTDTYPRRIGDHQLLSMKKLHFGSSSNTGVTISSHEVEDGSSAIGTGSEVHSGRFCLRNILQHENEDLSLSEASSSGSKVNDQSGDGPIKERASLGSEFHGTTMHGDQIIVLEDDSERLTSSILTRNQDDLCERLVGDESNENISHCAFGLHPEGTCSCGSLLMEELSSLRAGLLRISLLTEALSELLDDIQRLPDSLTFSMAAHPAQESVVNTFPLKKYKKSGVLRCEEDIEQCYICLDGYEEDDIIRLLPCRHEYHMSCIDKWLKEIHGVCPLCRRRVCEGLIDSPSPSS